MSQFTGILRQITKKASHPNSLLYNIQLERAKQKYFVQGQLDDGTDGAVALGAPTNEATEKEKNASDTEQPDGLNATEDKCEGNDTNPGVAPKAGQESASGKDVASGTKHPQNVETNSKA